MRGTRALLPYRQKIIHVRWSGESCWIRSGTTTSVSARGCDERSSGRGDPVLPRRVLETEILFPYSGTIFASKLGQLAGNHFSLWSKAGKTCVPWAS